LDNPDELLARVVEVELELVAAAGDGFTASELENINEVLVGDLGELAALISIKVDVIYIERGSSKTALANTVADRVGVRTSGIVPAEVVEGVELKVDAHFVVLESNERESKTRVAAEPELERDIESVHGSAAGNHFRSEGFASVAVIVTSGTTLVDAVSEFRNITYHLGITGLLTRLLGKFVPDVEPLTIVLVNALTTDFNLNIVDKIVANPVEPTELGTRTIGGLELDLRKNSLEVHAVDKVTVALDGAGHLLTEVRGTVEGIFNGLHGEVGVSAVDNLEKGDLWVASKIYILSTISY